MSSVRKVLLLLVFWAVKIYSDVGVVDLNYCLAVWPDTKYFIWGWELLKNGYITQQEYEKFLNKKEIKNYLNNSDMIINKLVKEKERYAFNDWNFKLIDSRIREYLNSIAEIKMAQPLIVRKFFEKFKKFLKPILENLKRKYNLDAVIVYPAFLSNVKVDKRMLKEAVLFASDEVMQDYFRKGILDDEKIEEWLEAMDELTSILEKWGSDIVFGVGVKDLTYNVIIEILKKSGGNVDVFRKKWQIMRGEEK